MHSTDNLEDGYIGSGKRLWHSINKHGRENHVCEILEFLDSRDLLKKREREIVNENLLNDSMCMNLILGGTGGFISEEQQKNRSILGGKAFSNKLKDNLEFRKTFIELQSAKLKKLHSEGSIKYDTFTGKSHSQETKNKISKSNSLKQKGSNNSQYGTCWITNEIENKKICKDNPIPNGWRAGRKI